MFNINDLGITLGTNIGISESTDNDIVLEDREHNHLIMEQIIVDNCIEDALEEGVESMVDLGEDDLLESADLLSERSIVRLDRRAKLNHATEMSVYAIARERNDRDFKKLVTVWKMERLLTKKLQKKYATKAMQRAKKLRREAAKKGKTKAVRGKSTKVGSVNTAIKRNIASKAKNERMPNLSLSSVPGMK